MRESPLQLIRSKESDRERRWWSLGLEKRIGEKRIGTEKPKP
jgi:hypothetical protein